MLGGYVLLCCLGLSLTAPADEAAIQTSIQEYQDKILALERSIRDVRDKTSTLERMLSTREKAYENCQVYLDEAYYRMFEAGGDDYEQLVSSLGNTVDKIFPVYKDLRVKNCDREPYIASLQSSRLTASSEESKHATASHSYLQYKQTKAWEREAWVPKDDDKDPWIQADLGTEKDIFAIGYAGRGDKVSYVKTFKVSISSDGVNWVQINKTFQGIQLDASDATVRARARESARGQIVIHEMQPLVKARYVRLHPLTYSWQRTVRWEIYGPKCQKNGEIGFIEARQGDGINGRNAHKMHARFSSLHSSLGWTAPSSDPKQKWQVIQVNLGGVERVEAIATRGKGDQVQWVNAFAIRYRNETTKKWQYYENGMIFNGNTDQNTIVVHQLEHPFETQYVQIQPKSWHVSPSLRWEVYGPSKKNFPDAVCVGL